MKRVYRLDGLDCAHCASKIEKRVAKISGVRAAALNLMTTRLTIECEDDCTDKINEEIQKIVKRIEPNVVVKRV